MESKQSGSRRPGSAPQRQQASAPQRQQGSASQRQQASAPQRRPPVQTPRRYPPPQSRTYPPPRSHMYSPPQPRAYPPPQVTKPPPPTQARQPAPHVTQPTQARQPAPTKPRPVAKPKPRFRDALWPTTPDAPALNRVAFACTLLYALIHIVCGVLFVYPMNLLTARMPFPLADIVRAVLPALIGAVLCALTRLPLQLESRVGLSAYRKLLRIVLTLFIGVLLLMWGDWAALRQVARFVLMFVSAPLIAGTGLSVLLFYLDWLYDDGDA